MWPVVVILELAIVGASGLEARANGSSWPLRWLWWHLAPFVAVALVVAAGLAPAARRVARRAVLEHQRKEARVLVERSPM